MQNVIFYNHFHNGDIHVSRNFVLELCKNLENKFNLFYCHKNDPELLKDNKYLTFKPIHLPLKYANDFIIKEGDIIYVNTWYSANKNKYLDKYQLSFNCIYFLFKDIYSHFGLNIKNINPDIFNFIPKIDYSVFYIQNVDNFCKNNLQKKILVCNGKALSRQANNINLTDPVLKLAENNPDKIWILTSVEKDFEREKYPNVYYSSEIIKKNSKCDLNEISYLSLSCDLIIGRASGPFTFSICQENILNTNKTMLTFSNIEYRENYSSLYFGSNKIYSNMIQSNANNTDSVYKIISELI